MTGLSVPFFFDSSLSDHVSGVIPLKVGRLELFDAPGEEKRNGKGQGLRVKALNDEPSFLLVEFVAHTLAKLLEFTFRLCVVGVDHEILEMP